LKPVLWIRIGFIADPDTESNQCGSMQIRTLVQ